MALPFLDVPAQTLGFLGTEFGRFRGDFHVRDQAQVVQESRKAQGFQVGVPNVQGQAQPQGHDGDIDHVAEKEMVGGGPVGEREDFLVAPRQ